MAEVGVSIEVNGLNDALRIMRSIDPQLRRQVDKEMKAIIGADIVPFARRLYPATDRIGNWGDWRYGYDQKQVQRGVKVSLKTTGKANQVAGYRLTQSTAAGVIFAFAGKETDGRKPTRGNGSGNSAAFIKRLERFGRPSRVLWPAILENRDKLELSVRDAVDYLMKTINKELR